VTEKGRVIVLGSGAAGSGAARLLAANGWDVTVVERGKVGGTCLWHGCMPKKSLYTSARGLRDAVEVDDFGISPSDGSFDWQTVLSWKWHAQETYAGDQEDILAERGIRLVKGSARFVAEDAVVIGDDRYEFDHAVIATGSHAVTPPIPGIELADTSETALGYLEVPSSLLVVGGGFIGLEFAGIFASFGSEVTVVTSGERPLEMVDSDVAAVALRHLERLGVEFYSECRMQELSGSPGSVEAQFIDSAGTLHNSVHERVLMAVGRTPAITDLDVAVAGIEVDERGRVVHDSYLRTTNPRVWIAGDAAGGMMHTPVASYEGRIVGESIDSGQPAAPDCHAIPSTVFTIPPLAQVGISEQEAQAKGLDVRVAKSTFEFSGAAIIENQRDGLVKYVFAAEDGRLLGAQIAGFTAADLIYGPALALKLGAHDTDLQDALGIHPAYSEVLNWAAY